MSKIITINSSKCIKCIKVKDMLFKKLTNSGFKVIFNLHKDTDLIISIGEDSSFLRTAKDFDYPNIPIVGINTNHIGLLSEINLDEIDKFIKCYKNNDYIIDERYLLKSEICNKEYCIDMLALNEIVVKGDKSRTLHLDLNVDNKHIQKFSGDGIIASTPTGSTAYSYSVSGSIIDPSLEVVQLTPLYPINTNAYRCLTSSIIFSNKSKITLVPECKFEKALLIVVDGVEYRFNTISHINISLSEVKIKLIRMPDYEFWKKACKKFL